MAITSITVFQDNVFNNLNVMGVHSPLVFLIDAEYTGDEPNFIYCEIFNEGNSLITVRCLYHEDVSESIRRFRFVADEILRSVMPNFDDIVQSGQSWINATNLSRQFNLVFQDDLVGTNQVNLEVEMVHAARQIGQNPTLDDVCANNNDLYVGGENKPVYVYFYDNGGGTEPTETEYALDYNDDIFVDFNDDKFTITP